MKWKKLAAALAAAAIAGAAFSACGSKNEESSSSAENKTSSVAEKATDEVISVTVDDVTTHDKFGGILANIPGDEFIEHGFEYGDSVDVTLSNGYEFKDLPFFNGYYSRKGENLLVAYPGSGYVNVQQNCGEDLWVVAGMTEGMSATFTLNEKGKYSDIQQAFSLKYENEREKFESDEEFANFREVKVGMIADGALYRSASPCDNKYNRAPYADKLAEQAGIGFIIDLADNDEDIAGYFADEDFNSPYFKSLYEQGKVAPASLGADYASEAYRKSLGEALIKALDSEGPILVHCTEGKDRTGFVICMLSALAGAEYDELKADYMVTFKNYYGVTLEKNEEQYNTIADNLFESFIIYLTDNAGEGSDLKTASEAYLRDCGLSDTQIAELSERLCTGK